MEEWQVREKITNRMNEWENLNDQERVIELEEEIPMNSTEVMLDQVITLETFQSDRLTDKLAVYINSNSHLFSHHYFSALFVIM